MMSGFWIRTVTDAGIEMGLVCYKSSIRCCTQCDLTCYLEDRNKIQGELMVRKSTSSLCCVYTLITAVCHSCVSCVSFLVLRRPRDGRDSGV